MKQVNFWESRKPLKKILPKPKLELPKSKIGYNRESRDLIRTAVGAGIGLAVLGAGVAAFKDATD